MHWLKLLVTTDVIQDRAVNGCVVAVAVADADAGIDHAELYCFVVRRIYLKAHKGYLGWQMKAGNSYVPSSIRIIEFASEFGFDNVDGC